MTIIHEIIDFQFYFILNVLVMFVIIKNCCLLEISLLSVVLYTSRMSSFRDLCSFHFCPLPFIPLPLRCPKFKNDVVLLNFFLISFFLLCHLFYLIPQLQLPVLYKWLLNKSLWTCLLPSAIHLFVCWTYLIDALMTPQKSHYRRQTNHLSLQYNPSSVLLTLIITSSFS